MHVVLSDYWDIYGPEVVSVELISDSTGLPVDEITLPGTFELRLQLRDTSGVSYVSYVMHHSNDTHSISGFHLIDISGSYFSFSVSPYTDLVEGDIHDGNYSFILYLTNINFQEYVFLIPDSLTDVNQNRAPVVAVTRWKVAGHSFRTRCIF
jgi:hypothetical protein